MKQETKRICITLDAQSYSNLKRLKWRLGLNKSAIIRLLISSAATESEDGVIRLTL
jgi:predicted DNA-binding protein